MSVDQGDAARRAAYKAYMAREKPPEVRAAMNGKLQVSLYDPDGTRTELMEAAWLTVMKAKASRSGGRAYSQER